jgi:hypothetical protein
VLEERVAVRCKAGEEALQVAANLGVGILLDEQRGGSVPEVKRGEAGLQTCLADERCDLTGHIGEPPAARGDGEFVEGLAEHGEGRSRIKIRIKSRSVRGVGRRPSQS